MESLFKMDLQLFAEEGGEPEANPPAGGEPAPAENTSGGTILGGAGNNEPAPANSPATNDNSQGAPDVYDFSALVPEGMEYDQQAAQEYGAIARECGLTQEQASKIASYGMQFMQNGVQAAMQQIVATQQKWGEDAKRQLGADFDKTVSRAAVGINRLSQNIPGIREALNETGAGNRIEMIQLMAAIGDLLGEDNGHGVPGYGGEKSLYPNTNFGQYK
jgi:hypothetical protein